jgi:hypothetical protein
LKKDFKSPIPFRICGVKRIARKKLDFKDLMATPQSEKHESHFEKTEPIDILSMVQRKRSL